MDVLAGLAPLQLLLTCGVVMLAAVLRAFTGFGFGLAAVPVFALLMAPSQAVVLSVSLTFAVSLMTVRTYWGLYPLRPLMPMLLMALLGTVAGTALLSHISPRQFQLWIGLAVIIGCIVLSLYRPQHREPGLWLASATGLGSGLMNGAFAIPGPPVIVYAMATEPDVGKSRALLLTFFLFCSAMALVIYAMAGFVTAAAPAQFALAFPAMWVGDKLGYALFRRYGTAMYRRVALVVLFAVGVGITGHALL